MSTSEASVLQDLRDAQARLNVALQAAQAAGLQVDLKVTEQRFVGAVAPLVTVSGRATRARVELDERL